MTNTEKKTELEEEVIDIKSDIGFKVILMKQLDRINEISSTLSNVNTNTENVVDAHWRSVNQLETIFVPYKDKEYEEELDEGINELKKKEQSSKDEMSMKYHIAVIKQRSLMNLLARKNLLLEEMVEGEI